MKKIILFTCTVLTLLVSCSSDDKNDIIYTLKTSTETLLFTNHTEEETQTLSIESNDSWTIELKDSDWLTLDKTNGEGNTEIKVTAQPNTSEVEKVIEFTIRGINSKNNTVKVEVKQTFKDINKEINILDYIPDAIFKQYLIEKVFDGATFVTKEDAKKVTIIKAGYIGIVSLEGIHFFTELDHLTCEMSKLTTLDVSKNTKLIKLDVQKNKIRTLDLSQNTELSYLDFEDNKLTNVDLSKNTELTYLNFSRNWFKAIDISKNTKLTRIDCSSNNNELTTLDVSKNIELSYLDCRANPITTLDLSKNTELYHLVCFYLKITTLDLSKNTKLTYLNCSGNQLRTLDLSKNTNLTYSNCYENLFTNASVLIPNYVYNNAILSPTKVDPIYKTVD